MAVCIKERSAENTVSLSTNQKQLEFFWQAFLVIVYWYWLWLSIESKQTKKKKNTKRSHSTQCTSIMGKIVQSMHDLSQRKISEIFEIIISLQKYFKIVNKNFEENNVTSQNCPFSYFRANCSSSKEVKYEELTSSIKWTKQKPSSHLLLRRRRWCNGATGTKSPIKNQLSGSPATWPGP